LIGLIFLLFGYNGEVYWNITGVARIK